MKFYTDIIKPYSQCGNIVEWDRQTKYELQPKFSCEGKTVSAIYYKCDFWVRLKDGSELVIDVKGCPDSVAKLKRKMMLYKYPDIKYMWVSYSKMDGGWIDYDVLKKARKERKKIKSKGANNA